MMVLGSLVSPKVHSSVQTLVTALFITFDSILSWMMFGIIYHLFCKVLWFNNVVGIKLTGSYRRCGFMDDSSCNRQTELD